MNPGVKREASGRYLSLGIANRKNEVSLALPGAATNPHTVGGRAKMEKNGILKILLEPLDPG